MRSKGRKKGWVAVSPRVIVITIILTVGAVTGGFFLIRGIWTGQRVSESAPGKRPVFTGTVKLNETLSIGDDLRITLTEIGFEDDPPKRKLTARVFLKGEPEMQIRKAEEESAITYPKEHGYTIEVLKIDSDSAKFSIIKNP